MLFISLPGLAGMCQLSLFLGIVLILFGWIEKKDKLILYGQIAFLILGIFALWILISNAVTIPVNAGSIISKESKILAFLRIVVIFMGLTLVSLVMSLLKIRLRKVSVIVVLIIALMLFFMIYSIQQMPN